MAPHRRLNTIEPKWLLVIVFFISGAFFGGLSIYLYLNQSSSAGVRFHFPKGTYNYINPTIVSEPNLESNFSSVSNDMQLKIEGIVSSSEKQNHITNAGVYFRDLENSKILAINADTEFSPGKLLKVPLMIAYYKLADDTAESLQKTVTVNVSTTTNEDIFNTADPLTQGNYTYDQLVTSMIVNNSDSAANALFDGIDKNILNEIFSDLGINFVEDKQTSDFISLRRYSFFMRMLYNASYLSSTNSEKALSLLVSNPTRSLLETNLPQAIPFASRVGGRKITMQGTTNLELFECDIVYFPAHNYLLCVSGKSNTLENGKEFFSKIGDAIYTDMNYQYGS